jgi:hypothetical protein
MCQLKLVSKRPVPGRGSGRRGQGLIGLCLALCLLAQLLLAACAGAMTSDNHWAREDIDYLIELGIVVGDQKGRINPERQMTRAELAAVINRAFGYTAAGENSAAAEGNSAAGRNNFSDVDENKWYAADLLAAKEAGYLRGDDFGNIMPDRPITRAEAAVILAGLLGLADAGDGADEEVPAPSTNDGPGGAASAGVVADAGEADGSGADAAADFRDSGNMTAAAAAAVNALRERQLIKGYRDNTFRPDRYLSRAEGFTMVAAILKSGLYPGGGPAAASSGPAEADADGDGLPNGLEVGSVKPLLENWDKVIQSTKPDLAGVVALYYSEVSIETVSLNDAGDGIGVATINVTAPDMKAVFARLLVNLEAAAEVPDEQLRMTAENAIASILRGEHEKTTATIDAQITYTPDGWRIVPDSAWSAAISGGMIELYREYYSRLFESSEMFAEGVDDVQE